VAATGKRLHPVDGLVSVGRWYKVGRKLIVGDLIYATNFDGRHTVMFDNDDDDLEEEDTTHLQYSHGTPGSCCRWAYV